MDKIVYKPTTINEEEIVLEDKDYMLWKVLRDLNITLMRLVRKL